MSKKSGHPVSKKFAAYPRLNPLGVGKDISAADLIDQVMLAYNGGRLREAAQLLAKKMLPRDGFIGMSLTGALTPAGLGKSCLIPLMKGGYVDWIISTGANLYHDLHFGLDMQLHSGSPFLDDVELREEGVIRIYDVLFPAQVLLDTDSFIRDFLVKSKLEGPVSSAELHEALGRHLLKVRPGCAAYSVVAAAAKYGVPIYTSSPGDSSIGMNVAYHELINRSTLQVDPNKDVNEVCAIIRAAEKNGCVILGGGSPKNFYLQGQPTLWEVYGILKGGNDYFIQITTDSVVWGGLSGATPAEAVSWGKVDPDKLPDSVVCYTDSTIALPLLTAYVLSRVKPRKLKRLYDHRDAILGDIKTKYLKIGTVTKVLTSRKIAKRASSVGLK